MGTYFDGIDKRFPYNFAFKILGSADRFKDVLPYRLEDCMAETCTERERKVVLLYFTQDGMTYEKVGKEIGVGPERVRQILQKVYRKMGHPSRAKMWLAMDPKDIREMENELAAYKLTVSKEQAEEVEENKNIIWDLELSVRSHNCLARRGITTIKEFDGLGVAQLTTIRNLGRKSAMEIVNHLVNYGFVLMDNRTGEHVPYTPYMGSKELIEPLPDSFLYYRFKWPKGKEAVNAEA